VVFALEQQQKKVVKKISTFGRLILPSAASEANEHNVADAILYGGNFVSDSKV
jgi:hypothetical protein